MKLEDFGLTKTEDLRLITVQCVAHEEEAESIGELVIGILHLAGHAATLRIDSVSQLLAEMERS